RLIIGTIPDYSVTPTGKQYALGRDVAEGLAAFNDVIRDEAEARNVAVVDFASIAAAMRDDPSLIAGDGLHPSAAAHLVWEAQIHPLAAKAVR
ncbi:MAG TPA: GDSL-type esterase/lipase family protein, partial [Candidatus Peribacteria bacterium]|nr:GDSL-type esterase/lipase family protein [Candidatus Peribacteria bacterium]